MPQGEHHDPSGSLELAHLYQRAPIALCVTDTDHRYVRINQRLCDINGKPMEAHVGHTIHEVVPHIADQIVSMFQKVIDTAEPVLDHEVRGPTLRHPGEERVFLGNHFPLISKTGEVQYVHTMVRDVTDQRRTETALRASNDRLEERVKQRTEELVRLSEDLKSEAERRASAQEEAVLLHAELAHVTRVRSMGELVASISHELNQPLAAVLTNAQAALRLMRGKNPNPEQVREILEDIVADDKRAGQVLNRLRALLQKEPVAKASVQLPELVSAVLPLVRSDALGANITITAKYAPNLPPVEVDPVQVQQVVMNLLINAITAIQKLDAEGGEIEVEISLKGENGVMITVVDNGPGIAAREINDVFKPFVTTKSGGLGMGLTICKSVLDAHGGTISVENSVPRGCRVSFVLPLNQPTVS